jgi:hypothetical protein
MLTVLMLKILLYLIPINSRMNKLFLFLIFSLTCLSLKAQIIDNKVDLSLGYGIGAFGGPVLVNVKGFISPSLYSNYDNIYGISAKAILRKTRYINFGASMNYLSASAWNAGLYTDYLNSRISQYSISPVIQIHNKIHESGFLNRFRIFLEIAPTVGFSDLSLTNPLFDIQSNNNEVAQPMGSNDLFYGINGTGGLEITINQIAGLFIDTSAGHFWVSSKLYNDNQFTNYKLELGIILRLKKNKRFFY